MAAFDNLRKVPLFRDLPESDLVIVCGLCSEARLCEGEILFRQGDVGDAAYVINSGAIEILMEGNGKQTRLALREQGEVIGEMALLQAEPRMASARAREDTELLVIPKPAIVHLLETSPAAVRILFDIILERLHSTEAQLRQHERMVQLGTLTAGVAHELNNPAAAVKRAADQLVDAVHRYADTIAVSAASHDATTLDAIARLAQRPTDGTAMGALDRSDLEQELEDALAEAGVDEPWTIASDLVDAGIRPADLRELGDGEITSALDTLGAGRAVESLLRSIQEGSNRLSAIVGALKSYSYLDQAPVQQVDVAQGIDDTIMLLGDKLSGIHIDWDRAPDLTQIEANGSELNQVWTNLLANAADAIAERRRAEGEGSAGRITICTANTGEGVVVEITDDGTGIPADIQDRIFDAFFTTKEPGMGTGLGLDISHRIVAMGHGGALTVDSEPGRTTFRAELPAS